MNEKAPVVALAGNPNVGKSTVFNALTGLRQHTGNWPGKTVESTRGFWKGGKMRLIDLPGAYSLLPHSAEEQVARDYLLVARPACTVVVCDAGNPERGLILAMQVIELGRPVVVCLNLADEAKKHGVVTDAAALQSYLGVPVVFSAARRRRGLCALAAVLRHLPAEGGPRRQIEYPEAIEREIAALTALLPAEQNGISPRYFALRLLCGDAPEASWSEAQLTAAARARASLRAQGYSEEALQDTVAAAAVRQARAACCIAVRKTEQKGRFGRAADRLLTGRRTAYPVMLLLLAAVLYLTLRGASGPSQLLADAFAAFEPHVAHALGFLPAALSDCLVCGVYRVLTLVIAVMLPPMAVFFPLFTLLEEAGFLPRLAFVLDRPFARCHACGKQALTMCMGLGCNAVGVTGCRIMDSPRERRIAVLTNVFMPCNGRLPLLVTLFSLLHAGWAAAALGLTALIAFAVALTLGVSFLLSKTVLRGLPSAFALEIPPYRRPRIGQTLVRSLLDRTLRVLSRAAAVAAPAGAAIYVLGQITVSGRSLLAWAALALDGPARYLGMDGVILLSFLLAFPANELTLPLMLMGYAAAGGVLETAAGAPAVLLANGWTARTVICTALFALAHWPCAAALSTIRQETGSLRWTAAAALLPTACGVALCLAANAVLTWCGVE